MAWLWSFGAQGRLNQAGETEASRHVELGGACALLLVVKLLWVFLICGLL